MLESFKKKSLSEKFQLVDDDKNSWYLFCSLFISGVIHANVADSLRRIFCMYHESEIKNKAILIETLSFETGSDQLPIEILKTLYNAYR